MRTSRHPCSRLLALILLLPLLALGAMATATGYAITTQCKKSLACWQFIAFLSKQAPGSFAPARRSLVKSAAGQDAEVAKIPQEKVMETMTSMLNGGQGGTMDEATALLWKVGDPWRVWVILGAVGLVSTLGMIVYYQKTKHSGISSNPAAPS